MEEQFYFKRTFSDFDDFADNLRKWKNVEIFQLERRIFERSERGDVFNSPSVMDLVGQNHDDAMELCEKMDAFIKEL